jgi:hypothetical protein
MLFLGFSILLAASRLLIGVGSSFEFMRAPGAMMMKTFVAGWVSAVAILAMAPLAAVAGAATPTCDCTINPVMGYNWRDTLFPIYQQLAGGAAQSGAASGPKIRANVTGNDRIGSFDIIPKIVSGVFTGVEMKTNEGSKFLKLDKFKNEQATLHKVPALKFFSVDIVKLQAAPNFDPSNGGEITVSYLKQYGASVPFSSFKLEIRKVDDSWKIFFPGTHQEVAQMDVEAFDKGIHRIKLSGPQGPVPSVIQ